MLLLAKFFRLPPEEKRFLVQALYLIYGFKLKLKFLPVRVVFVQAHGKATTRNRPVKRAIVSPERIASILKYLAFYTSSTCLPLALAGHVLMAKNGHKTVLHIGVAKDDMAKFEAHAWLTFDGNTILGKLEDIDRFKELPDIWSGVK